MGCNSQWSEFRRGCLFRLDTASLKHGIDNLIAPRNGSVGMLNGGIIGRAGDQSGQQGRFGRGELVSTLPKIPVCALLYAVDAGSKYTRFM